MQEASSGAGLDSFQSLGRGLVPENSATVKGSVFACTCTAHPVPRAAQGEEGSGWAVGGSEPIHYCYHLSHLQGAGQDDHQCQAQLLVPSHPFPLPGGIYSLVCLILNLTVFLPGDWVRAAWPIHNRQDLSPVCVQPALQLSGPTLSPFQGPARGTRVLLLPFGRTCYWAGLLRTCFPGQDGIRRELRKSGHFLSVCLPRCWEAQWHSRARGTQRDDPVSARTCPPATGRDCSSISGGQSNN